MFVVPEPPPTSERPSLEAQTIWRPSGDQSGLKYVSSSLVSWSTFFVLTSATNSWLTLRGLNDKTAVAPAGSGTSPVTRGALVVSRKTPWSVHSGGVLFVSTRGGAALPVESGAPFCSLASSWFLLA